MTLFGGVVVFTMAWWVLFFMALPFGAHAPEQPDKGHAAGAPERPRLVLKAVVTTVLAALVTAGFGYALETGLIDLRPQAPLLEAG